jgi:hypothetical protein
VGPTHPCLRLETPIGAITRTTPVVGATTAAKRGIGLTLVAPTIEPLRGMIAARHTITHHRRTGAVCGVNDSLTTTGLSPLGHVHRHGVLSSLWARPNPSQSFDIILLTPFSPPFPVQATGTPCLSARSSRPNPRLGLCCLAH